MLYYIIDVSLGHKQVDARSVQGCTQPSMQRREVPIVRLTIRSIRLNQRLFLQQGWKQWRN